VGCQFHPEFKSRPQEPHPLFQSFVAAALRQRLTKTVPSELPASPTSATIQ
jgi:hypothetical protein